MKAAMILGIWFAVAFGIRLTAFIASAGLNDGKAAPVAHTPNNWVGVEKRGEKKIVAKVGKETFEVRINVSLMTGKIISAKIDNPVEVLSRDCEDTELSRCGPPKR